MACFICGDEGMRGKMLDVISDSGLVQVCEKCAKLTDLPIIKRSEEIATRTDQALGRASAARSNDPYRINPPRMNLGETSQSQRVEELRKSQQQRRSIITPSYSGVSLRSLVDSKYDGDKHNVKQRSDLISNPHWTIMKVRRDKHITQEKMARDMKISMETLKKIEMGAQALDDDLVGKFEVYLGISLIKDGFRNIAPKEVGNPNVTLADLRELTQKKSSGQPYWRRVMGKLFGSKKEEGSIESQPIISASGQKIETYNDEPLLAEAKKRELSPDEINDLIFGNKK